MRYASYKRIGRIWLRFSNREGERERRERKGERREKREKGERRKRRGGKNKRK